MTILITGGAGFIGSHLIRHLVKNYPDYNLINLDALTYASDLSRLDDVNNAPNYQFVEGNINDTAILDSLFSTYSIEAVIHLAAESHVDRSIEGPLPFAKTNIVELKDGKINEFTIDPRDLGLNSGNKENLKGKNAEYNSEKIIDIYKGTSNEFSQSVALNAAAGLIVAGKENNFKNAFKKTSEHLNSGKVFEHLTKLQSK